MEENHKSDDVLKRPELVFGIIGAVGTDTGKVIDLLKAALSRVKYDISAIRLIDGIREFEQWSHIQTEPLDKRYNTHMDAGNAFRELLKRGDAFSMIAVGAIREERKHATGDPRQPKPGIAYVLRSIKRPEEIWTLREVYGRNFFALAAYSSKSHRLERLTNLIAHSRLQPVSVGVQNLANELIERDEAELQYKFGQNISEAFPIADFFVDADCPTLAAQITRIVELIFGNTFHTPTREEYGMFHAWAASLRSASLGRQVGAAVCTDSGDLLATGCNEVPKASGGLYWQDDIPDGRDHVLGFDSNDKIKHEILVDLITRLKMGGWLAKKKSQQSVRELLEEAMKDPSQESLKKATLMGITEYGRMVHAEMAALMQAARLGISVQDAYLFATTFPCHNCTKHIVAAGISRLIFIEPYPKSRASELHGDSIAVEQPKDESKRVWFKFFVGISPRQYFTLFSLGDSSRKQGGKVKAWQPENAIPRLVDSPFAYLSQEEEVLEVFDSLLKKTKLVLVEKRL